MNTPKLWVVKEYSLSTGGPVLVLSTWDLREQKGLWLPRQFPFSKCHGQASNCGAFPNIPVCDAGLEPPHTHFGQSSRCVLQPPTDQPGPTSLSYCHRLPEIVTVSSSVTDGKWLENGLSGNFLAFFQKRKDFYLNFYITAHRPLGILMNEWDFQEGGGGAGQHLSASGQRTLQDPSRRPGHTQPLYCVKQW